jgi:hypothetical protein
MDLAAVVPLGAGERNRRVGHAQRRHREPEPEARGLTLDVAQIERAVLSALDAEQALERVVLAAIACVVSRDDIDEVAFARIGAVGVVAVLAEGPEVMGQVVGEERSAHDVGLCCQRFGQGRARKQRHRRRTHSLPRKA